MKSLILASIIGLVVNSQTCDYSADDKIKGRGLDQFEYGDVQYVIFDFGFSPGKRGLYYLPFQIYTLDEESTCHPTTFLTVQKMSFECSDDDDWMTMNYYASGSCGATATLSYSWEKGYTPYMNPSTLDLVSNAVCNGITGNCTDLGFERYEVTPGSGNRFDFSCEGDNEWVESTLCVSSTDCTTSCSTFNASLGAQCMATPNNSYTNLFVNCDKNYAYLTTYFSLDNYNEGEPWNDYTIERECVDEVDGDTGGYVCRDYKAGVDCGYVFTAKASGVDLDIYGKMSTCTAPYNNVACNSNLSFSILLLLAIASMFLL